MVKLANRVGATQEGSNVQAQSSRRGGAAHHSSSLRSSRQGSAVTNRPGRRSMAAALAC